MPAKLHYNFIKHHIENFGYKFLKCSGVRNNDESLSDEVYNLKLLKRDIFANIISGAFKL